MATPAIKATYTLDLATVEALVRMARHLGVSKSEALRRAIELAARELPVTRNEGLLALEALQRTAGLSEPDARRQAAGLRRERRAASSRRTRARR